MAVDVRSFYGMKRPRSSAANEEEEQNTTETVDPRTSRSGALGSMTSSTSSRHVKKRSLLEPEPVYKVFPRQKMALEFALNCYQSVGIFSFESEEFGREGQRRYIVATYYDFGKRYLDGKVSEHCYEVIPEGAACHLYFDIEFKREVNPTVDPILVLEIFIQYVCYQLCILHHVTCDHSNILDLDSTTPQKFSRHLIFHIPSTVFRNNILAGQFVRSICDHLRNFDHLVERGMEVDKAYKQVYSSSKGTKTGPSCPSGEELLQLFVKNERGGKVLICDEAVYTRNRNFRLYRSSKLGKTTKLRVAKENKFRSSYPEGTLNRKRWNYRFNTLMDSLVCNVSFLTTEHMRILPSGSVMGHTVKIKPDHSMPSPTPADSEVSIASSNSATVSEEAQAATGFSHSPFPSVDSFITSQLTKGGVQGSIRRWTYFPTGKLILYDIQHNRWCENIGRAHKSNNIMMIADLKKGIYYQKCHDPDCQRINFRSNEIVIPLEYNPVLQQLEEERRQAEETKLYIGDVSLEDILDQGPEETAPIVVNEQIQEEASQASPGLTSGEPKLLLGSKNLTSIEKFPLSYDSSKDIDMILKEALEDYEDRISPAGDQLVSANN